MFTPSFWGRYHAMQAFMRLHDEHRSSMVRSLLMMSSKFVANVYVTAQVMAWLLCGAGSN